MALSSQRLQELIDYYGAQDNRGEITEALKRQLKEALRNEADEKQFNEALAQGKGAEYLTEKNSPFYKKPNYDFSYTPSWEKPSKYAKQVSSGFNVDEAMQMIKSYAEQQRAKEAKSYSTKKYWPDDTGSITYHTVSNYADFRRGEDQWQTNQNGNFETHVGPSQKVKPDMPPAVDKTHAMGGYGANFDGSSFGRQDYENILGGRNNLTAMANGMHGRAEAAELKRTKKFDKDYYKGLVDYMDDTPEPLNIYEGIQPMNRDEAEEYYRKQAAQAARLQAEQDMRDRAMGSIDQAEADLIAAIEQVRANNHKEGQAMLDIINRDYY